ncbi:hypothetical protein K2173_011075 [Erythroxylum novogranatense]|uniref:Zinc finger PHD-type domain-containing protein n=1 Tax=Erythroxylum novogranatense TaxID=1862640 RepID=A0AAV8TIY6_9ROSI|nr:hypothetical protein K2173_011075 [Erythroxylum novogranatense]
MLFLLNYRPRWESDFSSYNCKLCDRELLDMTYGCFRCDFYLHKRSVEITQQECELQHPCHSHHPVSIEYGCGKFICDQCRDLCSGIFMAICKECDFKIDFKCTFFREATIQKSIGNEVKTQIRYFNHDLHLLSFFNYTVNHLFDKLNCEGCLLPLLGPICGCLECSVYLHKSCAELPRTIEYPYHPFHIIFLENFEGYCRACGNYTKSLRYRCLPCPSFLLDTKYKFNDHILNYFKDMINFLCYLCEEFEESVSSYKCSYCRMYLHKECVELPFKIKGNLHEHPLSITGGQFLKRFICDGCHVCHEKNMCYHYEEGSFFLDRMCAQEIPFIDNDYRKLNDNGSNVGFSHFSHNHKLRFTFIPKNPKVLCLACSSQFSGPTYCYYICSFFLHESCSNLSIFSIPFTSNIPCTLQSKCHKHNLFYFVAEDMCYDDCEDCGKVCDASFYCCLECDLNVHIDCIPIPKNIKSVCHVHPLTLMDTIIEEEVRDKYYCHACKCLRNPKHAAYYCKKCYYTAYIGCVVVEVRLGFNHV